ncbi:MAG: Crp/Fnr family transcriptional regulator [Rhodospirillaceae bacterium]|nr:Crp/Fnr family transcriptional regulator [Rhodospirillaceae bacterium]MBT5945448.1 Crp/Fnr family transcriptional regulator [Rhodospirillaceae bacterium]MBT6405378.1 Crp/Fnr family transcriptional regulator [Rhodospirillaceae bacterium]MBT6535105.1 Crp/Fnr family transcriptional regulator [Rhodospirillaceae bacterium]MBT7360863.1 Crp/Fnr family transcriptional regulator [Rhodospirillaceae bacterium]
MSLNEEVELLRNIPLFAKLEPSKLKLLAFTAERITYEPDQNLFSQGDVGDAAYIIVEGAAKVIVDTPDGELEVAALGRNDFVGEIAILCDVPRTATVRASAKTITLRITKDLFFRLVAEFPEMSVEIMRELASRLEHTTQQLREALAKNS